MTPNQIALVTQLAAGDFVSGETLGSAAGVSRAAIWKQLQQLQVHGIAVESVKGRGYRIPGGLDLLDERRIVAGLSPHSRSCLRSVHLEAVVDSTSSRLLRLLNAGEAGTGTLCLAEQQTAGRGRRGRPWVSPFARNLYCSLAWEFEQGVAALEGLSLAVGVATVSALERLGVEGIQLKWPNDLLWQGRKLGGVLLELSGEASGLCQVVIGIGLNVNMPKPLAGSIDQPWVDLAEITGGEANLPRRNQLAAMLVDELIVMLCRFQEQGFAAYRTAWERYNAYAGQQVNLITAAQQVRGTLVGITEQGGLRLNVDGVEQVFLGGEISLRGVS